jgi:protein-tyrosine phosphatase
MEQPRLIPLQGAKNFRDIGGLPGWQGRMLKRGMLYRSDDLSKLTRGDVARLEQLGLRLVIDLRTPDESKTSPDRLPASPGLRCQQIPFHISWGDLTSAGMFRFVLKDARQFDFHKFIVDLYHDIAFNQAGKVGEIFNLISMPENQPALIHCTSGKDRTGILAALIQLLAEVPPQVVMADYLQSNHLSAARLRAILRFTRWISLFRVTAEQMQPALEVRPEYLEAILDEIQSKHDGVEGYLVRACEVSPDRLGQLKQSLLAAP